MAVTDVSVIDTRALFGPVALPQVQRPLVTKQYNVNAMIKKSFPLL